LLCEPAGLTGVAALDAAPLALSAWRQAHASQALASHNMTVLVGRAGALFSAVPLYRLRRPRALEWLDDIVAAAARFAQELPLHRAMC